MNYKRFTDEIEYLYAKAEKDFNATKEHTEFMNILRRFPQYKEKIEPVKNRYDPDEYERYLKQKRQRDLISYIIAYNAMRSYYFYRRGLTDFFNAP